MEVAYIAVGKAVLAAQMLETALVPIYEIHRLHTEPARLQETGGFLAAGAFKVPVANIVKALATKGSIAPDLQARLVKYNEDRHLLVHRWVQEQGSPVSADAAYFLRLATHALQVEREALDLARIIVGYVVRYAEPEWAAANMDEFRAKMRNIFLDVSKEP